MDTIDHNAFDHEHPSRDRWVYPPAPHHPDETEQRTSFLNGAEIELRTRLTPVKGFGQLLERMVQHTPLDQERVVSMVTDLNSEIAGLEALIIKYLNACRLQWDGRDLTWHAVDLASLTRQVLERFDDAPERTPRHTLRVDEAEAVQGICDPTWLAEALAAIISNALRYSPDGGDIQLTLRRSNAHVLLSVSDPGLGIRPDERERIFLPFVRGSAARVAPGGWGLGLFIAGRVAEVHGGRIEVESAPGAGSVFTVRLPLLPAGPSAVSAG